MEQRANIKFCFKLGKTATKIYEMIRIMYGSEAISPGKTKQPSMQKNRIKTLSTVFFDSEGIIHREFIPEGQTVNSDYYFGVLNRLWDRIHRVRPEY